MKKFRGASKRTEDTMPVQEKAFSNISLRASGSLNRAESGFAPGYRRGEERMERCIGGGLYPGTGPCGRGPREIY